MLMGGVPKRYPLLGVPIIRTIVYWGILPESYFEKHPYRFSSLMVLVVILEGGAGAETLSVHWFHMAHMKRPTDPSFLSQ